MAITDARRSGFSRRVFAADILGMATTEATVTESIDKVGEAALELFAESPAYNELLWSTLTSLGSVEGRVLEVGCGIGTITSLILAEPAVTSVHGIDLDPAYVDRALAHCSDERLTACASSLEEFDSETQSAAVDASFDRIVCSNVLEHIEDDVAAMQDFARLLRPGGKVLLLVPAHPWLFSSLDENLSHFRRYRKTDFEALAAKSGLRLARTRHFNPLGILGWWLNGKVLRRPTLPAGQLRAYSRFAVPVSRVIDRMNPLPLGISILGVFERP
jgi:SAM-dependent methyltransferase